MHGRTFPERSIPRHRVVTKRRVAWIPIRWVEAWCEIVHHLMLPIGGRAASPAQPACSGPKRPTAREERADRWLVARSSACRTLVPDPMVDAICDRSTVSTVTTNGAARPASTKSSRCRSPSFSGVDGPAIICIPSRPQRSQATLTYRAVPRVREVGVKWGKNEAIFRNRVGRRSGACRRMDARRNRGGGSEHSDRHPVE